MKRDATREARIRKRKPRHVGPFQRDGDGPHSQNGRSSIQGAQKKLVGRQETKLGSGKEGERIVENRNIDLGRAV